MSTELALTRPDPTLSMESLRVQMEAAKRFVDSGLLPKSINTPQQALIIMAQGKELGIPATVALRSIVVVQGKPTCSAELMMALVHRSYGQAAMRVFKTDNESCTIQYRQQGWDGISEYTFSMEDAKRAGLTKNPTWGQYPAAMLRARAISAVVRFAFPECISGVYAPGELGEDVSVSEDGSIEVQSTGPALAKPAQVLDGDFEEAATCNKRQHLAYWHKAVAGTRFEQDDMRHKFIAFHTQNAYSSLSEFLDQATEDEAAALIVAVEKRIAHDARKARADLEAALNDAIKRGNAAGGDFTPSKNVADLSDDEIRDMIGTIESALAATV